jgi:hypothetical protein
VGILSLRLGPMVGGARLSRSSVRGFAEQFEALAAAEAVTATSSIRNRGIIRRY